MNIVLDSLLYLHYTHLNIYIKCVFKNLKQKCLRKLPHHPDKCHMFRATNLQQQRQCYTIAVCDVLVLALVKAKALFQILASIIQSLTPISYSLPCLQFWAPAPGPGSGPWLILYSWHDTRNQIVHISLVISKGKSDIREISTLLTELQLCVLNTVIYLSAPPAPCFQSTFLGRATQVGTDK